MDYNWDTIACRRSLECQVGAQRLRKSFPEPPEIKSSLLATPERARNDFGAILEAFEVPGRGPSGKGSGVETAFRRWVMWVSG